MNRTAFIALKAKVQAGADFDWGFCDGPARHALPDAWNLAMQAYIGSLDAAKALHEAVLPGWFWSVDNEAEISLWNGAFGEAKREVNLVKADRPARAWLLAILSALIAMEPEEREEPREEKEEGY